MTRIYPHDFTKTQKNRGKVTVSLFAQRALIDGLVSCTSRLKWRPDATEWGDYYRATNYIDSAMESKERIVNACLDRIPEKGSMMDLGANTGRFSQLGVAKGFQVIAMDIDELAVERCYLRLRTEGVKEMLPLVQDLSNPTPALGWAHAERMSLLERGPVTAVMALALIHHLAISNNVPLARCAQFFSALAEYLIIEFVPKTDSQVELLLQTRKDIFPQYSQAGFEAAFSQHFSIVCREPVAGSLRHIYLLRTRAATTTN